LLKWQKIWREEERNWRGVCIRFHGITLLENETDHHIGYEQIELQKTILQDLPEQIAGLEATIDSLRTEHPSPAKSSNPNLNLPLPATLTLLSERESELSSLDAQIRALQNNLPRKSRELERLESELQPLMAQKKTVVSQAKEARKRREEGGVDDMEQKGRWYRASHTALQQMLGAES
jgi:chromosome segregation ATPase